MEGASIRRARRNDLAALCEMQRNYMTYHRRLDRYFDFKPNMTELWLPYIKTLLRDSSHIVLIAEASGKSVGYAIGGISRRAPVYTDSRVAEILDLYVRADEKSKKAISRDFVFKIVEWARTKKVDTVVHPAASRDKSRISLNRELGFEEVIASFKLKIE